MSKDKIIYIKADPKNPSKPDPKELGKIKKKMEEDFIKSTSNIFKKR
ncbi:hypothetical protein [Flavipsychrobacter stenotrophus]|nr:hypothetical protein [Flavipsychrobacter stenotrophus]